MTRRGQSAVAAASELYIIFPFVRFPEMRFTAVEGMDLRVFFVSGRHYWEVCFEQPMTKHPQSREHRSAQDHGIEQGSTFNIFDDIG